MMMKGLPMLNLTLSMRVRAMGAGSALVMAALMPVAAHAAGAAPAAAQDTSAGTGEIIVTAMKKSESVLKVPAAIQVLGGNDLKTAGVNTVSDIQNLVPGVNIGSGSFGTNVSIRGVTSSDETSKGELGIAFNIDGAFVGRGQEEGVAFFDLDRVEVLKGPQGTLYGRSSTGGAINVISKKPVIGAFDGYANVEFGNYNTKRITAALNVPLGDTLALRVAGNSNDRDGFLKPVNTTVTGATGTVNLSGAGQPAKDDQHDRTGRFSLLFKPNADVTATAIATVGHIGGVGQSAALLDNLNAGGSAQFNVVPNSVPTWVDENFANFNEQLNWKLGGVQLDLLGSEQHFSDHSQQAGNYNPFDTGSPTAGPSFGLDDYQGVFSTTQFEARISNNGKGFLEYVAGANYYHEHVHESDHNWFAPVNADGSLSATSSWINNIDPLNTTQHKSYGVFAQITAHPTDKLSLIAGARYTHDDSNRVGTFSVGAVAGCSYPNDCIGGPNNGDAPDHKVTWKLGANYQASPNNLFYASVATGFKAGGFNDFDPRTGTTSSYKPENLTAYEIGYKGKPAAGVTFTSSAYYYDYSADQINGLTLFPTSAGVVGVLFTQVVPTEIYGWENTLSYKVDHNTNLSVSLAYQHTRIVSLQTGFLGYLTGAFANWHDYALPSAPSVVANLVATHNWDLAGGAQLRWRGAMKISSSYWLNDTANAVQYKQNGYTRSDASLTYATQGDRLTVQLFAENIENKLQKTAGPNNYQGTYGGFDGSVASAEADGTSFPTKSMNFGVSTPRFFGVRLGAKF